MGHLPLGLQFLLSLIFLHHKIKGGGYDNMNINKQSLPTQNTIPGFLQEWLLKSIRHKLARCEIILQ